MTNRLNAIKGRLQEAMLDDEELIAHAQSDIRWLLGEVESLAGEVLSLRAEIEAYRSKTTTVFRGIPVITESDRNVVLRYSPEEA